MRTRGWLEGIVINERRNGSFPGRYLFRFESVEGIRIYHLPTKDTLVFAPGSLAALKHRDPARPPQFDILGGPGYLDVRIEHQYGDWAWVGFEVIQDWKTAIWETVQVEYRLIHTRNEANGTRRR